MGVLRSLEWAWKQKEVWGPFECNPLTHRWDAVEPIEDDVNWYGSMLDAFGLREYPGEFPPNRILYMSPEELIKTRKAKERECSLPSKFPDHNDEGQYIQNESSAGLTI